MTDSIPADLTEAVTERLNKRREQARARREREERFRLNKKARRDAGLKARHARKLNRKED